MPDPKFRMRAGDAAEVVTGTPGHVLTFQADGTLRGEPPGGGSGAPIQNVRFLDPTFAGTPNGSIGAPFVLFADFFAEVVASGVDGWELTLPGTALTPDAAVPDLVGSPTVVFTGVTEDGTNIDLLTVASQSGSPGMVFRHVDLTHLALGAGTINFEFEDCFAEAITVGGTLQGSARLINCQVTDMSWGAAGNFSLEMLGGSISGNCSWPACRFWDVKIGDGTTITPGADVQRFVGCEFGTGVTISNANLPTVALDPYSFSTFVENAVTYAGQLQLSPVVPVIGEVSLAGGANQVQPNDTQEFDFGDPVAGLKAEPGSKIVGIFQADPGTPAVSLQGLRVDGVTGHVMGLVANNSGATITLSNPTTITIVYEPRTTP